MSLAKEISGTVTRPKYARDKTITRGMRLYPGRKGSWEARKRAPAGGGLLIGVVLDPAQVEDGAKATIGLTNAPIGIKVKG